jgi:protease IV
MALDADQIVERRRLRRRVSLWRVLAIILAGVAVVAGLAAAGATIFDPRPAHIARVEMSGLITGGRGQIEMLRRIAESSSVRALVVVVDSPGGTTAGSEAIHDAIRKVAEEKPVVAQLETVAASGGYAVALAADHIVARRNTITGSIGVVMQWADVRDLLDSLGVEIESVKSDPLKAAPSPFEPTTEEARAMLRGMVDDSYDWFIELVAERRGLDSDQVRAVGDGRVMTGRQALAAALVDALGGEAEARDWLAETHDIDRDTSIRDWRPSSSIGGIGSGSAVAWLARVVGLEAFAQMVERRLATGGVGLDGLVSVWHPQVLEE